MAIIRHVSAAAFLLLVGGCTIVTKIDAGRVNIDGEYTVQTPIVWAKVALGGANLWTVDGLGLQDIRFVTALEDGDPLFAGANSEKAPKLRKTMGPLEVVDFFQASLATNIGSAFQSRNLRPAPFGKKPGFRFEFSYLTKDGLAMEGFANGAIINNKLYMIIYTGTQQYYFERHRKDAETIVSSIVFS